MNESENVQFSVTNKTIKPIKIFSSKPPTIQIKQPIRPVNYQTKNSKILEFKVIASRAHQEREIKILGLFNIIFALISIIWPRDGLFKSF